MKTLLTTLLLFASLAVFSQKVQIKFKGTEYFQVVNNEYELFWGSEEVFTIYVNDVQYQGEMVIALENAHFPIELSDWKYDQYYIVQVVDGGLLWTFGAQQHFQKNGELFEI